MLTFRLHHSCRIAPLLLASLSAWGQSIADPPARAETLQEVESLKNRLEQLEAELRKAPEPVPTVPAAARSAEPCAQAAPAAAQPQQKREPFSFADFTWLTGNPRTTESPLHTEVQVTRMGVGALDAGCEFGENSGVSCTRGTPAKPSQYFLDLMTYQRFWFHKDLFAFTIGGGAITNPGQRQTCRISPDPAGSRRRAGIWPRSDHSSAGGRRISGSARIGLRLLCS